MADIGASQQLQACLLHMALTIGNNIIQATGKTQEIVMCYIPDLALYLKQRKYLPCYFGDD